MSFKYIILFLVITLILGCASTKKRSKEIVSDSFITDIKENGTKLFVYVANFRTPKIKPQKIGGQGRNNSQQQPVKSMSSIRSDIADKQEELTIEALELKLTSTDYCRTGYFVLGNYNQFGSVEIRGECREGASDIDRKLFE